MVYPYVLVERGSQQLEQQTMTTGGKWVSGYCTKTHVLQSLVAVVVLPAVYVASETVEVEKVVESGVVDFDQTY